jgi:hypothetical protein
MTANTDITQKRRRKRKGRVGDNPLETRRGIHASIYLDGTDYRKGHCGATNFAEA